MTTSPRVHVSEPRPPSSVSVPTPPSRRSSPKKPVMVSSPRPPRSRSSKSQPESVSLPPRPRIATDPITSNRGVPTRTSAPGLPTIVAGTCRHITVAADADPTGTTAIPPAERSRAATRPTDRHVDVARVRKEPPRITPPIVEPTTISHNQHKFKLALAPSAQPGPATMPRAGCCLGDDIGGVRVTSATSRHTSQRSDRPLSSCSPASSSTSPKPR